ncbi:MAG: sensor histidine kinase, partial [Halovenus sp.]
PMVSLDRYPDPACSYCFEDGKPIITGHNEQFSSICALDQGDSLQKLYETGLSFRRSRPTFDQIERIWVQDDSGGEYLLRIIAPEDGEPGHLLFTAAGEADRGTKLGVDRMASVLSHDLRNPLDVARARLRAGRELEEDRQFEHVEQAHDRIERIIQDVLTLARGEDVVTPEQRADLGDIARVAWQTVETDGAEIEVTDDLPTVVVDRDRASRLFENLFRNAVEHGPPDGLESAQSDSVTVTVGQFSEGVFVADDGTGIPEDSQDRIFEPGYSSDEHGTGLGLAIVERIADLHGWAVDVRTSEAGGARFEITGLDAE